MKKGTITTHLWDASAHLETEEDMALYLEAALEEKDPALISAVLGDIPEPKVWPKSLKKLDLDGRACIKLYPPMGILNRYNLKSGRCSRFGIVCHAGQRIIVYLYYRRWRRNPPSPLSV
jgi:hypothetical protein